MTEQEVYNETITKWNKNRGIGSISYDKAISLFEPIKVILNRYFAYSPNKTVIVIVANKFRIDEWTTALLTNFNHYDKIGNNQLQFLTADNIILNNIKEEVDLVLIDQIEKFIEGKRLDILKKKYINFKYILGVTNVAYPDKDRFDLFDTCPVIHRVTKVDIITNGILNKVEEYNVGVDLNPDDLTLYKSYNEFIKDTIDMFGSFDMIMKCYLGDSDTGISADHFRNQLAAERGWSIDIDLSNEYNKNIDRYYNPNSIFERAKTFKEILTKRQVLLSDNDSKLSAVLDIIENNKDSKVLIINKRSEFARKINNAINEYVKNPNLKSEKSIGNLFKPATNNIGSSVMSNFMCVEYHPNVESRPLIDNRTGDYVKIKSGENKGMNKVFGATSLNKIANTRFNEGYHNVISSISAIPKDGEFVIDFIIITSPECSTVNQLQYRLSKLEFKENVKIVNIFINNTKEVDKLKELQALNKNKIIEVNNVSDIKF